ncbi:MAG: hypothetical protein HY089_08175 [Ignavibacteriales bacterium]|nr:hypothetical protein [Ignavibacteriales bacterium]
MTSDHGGETVGQFLLASYDWLTIDIAHADRRTSYGMMYWKNLHHLYTISEDSLISLSKRYAAYLSYLNRKNEELPRH